MCIRDSPFTIIMSVISSYPGPTGSTCCCRCLPLKSALPLKSGLNLISYTGILKGASFLTLSLAAKVYARPEYAQIQAVAALLMVAANIALLLG